jgi:hypothetical protein
MREPGNETTEDFDTSAAIEQSPRINDSRSKFERWDDTDSDACRHDYYEEDVAVLDQWDNFARRTTASKLTVCRKCGFIPGSRRY